LRQPHKQASTQQHGGKLWKNAACFPKKKKKRIVLYTSFMYTHADDAFSLCFLIQQPFQDFWSTINLLYRFHHHHHHHDHLFISITNKSSSTHANQVYTTQDSLRVFTREKNARFVWIILAQVHVKVMRW
jgi:hypothetical protein